MSPEDYKAIASRWMSGVSIVTASTPGGPLGAAVSAVMPLSLSPAQFAVGLSLRSETLAAIRDSRAFCINILARSQQDYCRRFSGPRDERFEGIEYGHGKLGVPVLAGGTAHVECKLADEVASGDHAILIGAAHSGSAAEHAPLGYFGSEFWELAPCM